MSTDTQTSSEPGVVFVTETVEASIEPTRVLLFSGVSTTIPLVGYRQQVQVVYPEGTLFQVVYSEYEYDEMRQYRTAAFRRFSHALRALEGVVGGTPEYGDGIHIVPVIDSYTEHNSAAFPRADEMEAYTVRFGVSRAIKGFQVITD